MKKVEKEKQKDNFTKLTQKKRYITNSIDCYNNSNNNTCSSGYFNNNKKQPGIKCKRGNV